ncbi:MAG TPA: LON peptidase substrate-binding domain-containing protein [Stellaceae bacterium]|nr:LON peptidase substrate-binding domain-containing protein [Stellaceae bacterium]
MSDRPSTREPIVLPQVLPIFPLTGVLLLPRGRLPLNIFEPRYLAMTSDALGGERLIGMVQPSEPQNDGRGGGGISPALYPVGCAGRLTQFSETDDGRYLITLTGVSRFRIVEELPLLSGYRRVVPDWLPFADDRRRPEDFAFDRERLLRGLRGYFAQRKIEADFEAIEKAPGEYLVTSLAMACPFAPSEKQALLEASDLDARAELLTALVEMAAIESPREDNGGAGTRH